MTLPASYDAWRLQGPEECDDIGTEDGDQCKPLTDADIAALTRRLADTAIEHSELYQAAKRDAEEAEAYAASLESDMKALTDMLRASKHRNDALESKLAKAVEALETIVNNGGAGSYHLARTTLAELKGPTP